MNPRKRLAARILKISPKKVVFDESALSEIKEAITRSDLRGLIAIGKISVRKTSAHSRAGARKNQAQKRKGRQKGRGSKKGSSTSIVSRKETWMRKIRTLRKFLKLLREKEVLNATNYRKLYQKSKGGYFRNKRHMKLYIEENKLTAARETEKTKAAA
ncbi:50S ribosomal protein L19e [archaeon]|jgi:large subunit ribosomal protein L19e|nr:50S ribosomal protein L19e [archaeon]MBT6697678.1 50S ribosomal protein L19e [archaeon]